MSREYSPEQFWQLYKKLPQELKEALFAEETGEVIDVICKRNGVEENLGDIINYVGQVLIGILPPEEFQRILEKELELEKEVAKKVFYEISRFVFYPVKAILEEIYKVPITPPPVMPRVTPPVRAPEELPEELLKELPPEAPPTKKKSKRVDVYRELIE